MGRKVPEERTKDITVDITGILARRLKDNLFAGNRSYSIETSLNVTEPTRRKELARSIAREIRIFQ